VGVVEEKGRKLDLASNGKSARLTLIPGGSARRGKEVFFAKSRGRRRRMQSGLLSAKNYSRVGGFVIVQV